MLQDTRLSGELDWFDHINQLQNGFQGKCVQTNNCDVTCKLGEKYKNFIFPLDKDRIHVFITAKQEVWSLQFNKDLSGFYLAAVVSR